MRMTRLKETRQQLFSVFCSGRISRSSRRDVMSATIVPMHGQPSRSTYVSITSYKLSMGMLRTQLPWFRLFSMEYPDSMTLSDM